MIPANNACLAAAPNLVLVVMLGTGTEGHPSVHHRHRALIAPRAERPKAAQDAGLASACRIQGGIDAWKKAGGPLLH